MINAYVLIFMVMVPGHPPAMTQQVYATEAACIRAMDEAAKLVIQVATRDRVQFGTACVPFGTPGT